MKTLVQKSITKLSLVLLTAAALAAFPANAQTASASTNAPVARRHAPDFSGVISSADATGMTLTLKGRTSDITVKVTSDTKITKDREPAVFGDIKAGFRANGMGKKQDDGSWVATTLRINTKVRRARATPPPASSDQK